MSMELRCSSVRVDAGTVLQDIHFAGPAPTALCAKSFDFAFLGVVDTSKIPLALIAGPSHDVWTANEATLTWFSERLAEDGTDPIVQSHLGVLVAAEKCTDADDASSLFTEVVFYTVAVNSPGLGAEGDDEPTFALKAIPLCAQAPAYLPSPPLSPQASAGGTGAEFLPSLTALRVTSLAAEKKRKQVADVFDEATERRRKARRHGGEGVAAAASLQNGGVNLLVGQKRPKAASKTQTSASGQIPAKNVPDHAVTTGFQRPRSRTGSVSGFSHERPGRVLSRSPSISSETRPASRRGPIDSLAKRSTLSRVSSLTEASSTEQRNKDVISRLVMAGMRLYGLQPRKRDGHVRRHSEMHAQVQTDATDPAAQEAAAKDEEYKLVYHQTYKGAVFAFRQVISSRPLYSDPTPVQDIVDKLLAIFCSDPLVPAFGAAATETTFDVPATEIQPV